MTDKFEYENDVKSRDGEHIIEEQPNMTIEYKIDFEPENIPVLGNVFHTDDSEFDRKQEEEIIARLDNGDISAWCCIKVTASIAGFSHTEYLGGCSFTEGDTEAQINSTVEEYVMKDEARRNLFKHLNEALSAPEFSDLKDT